MEERTFFHCWYQLNLQPLWDCSVPLCFLKVSSFYSQQSASVLSSDAELNRGMQWQASVLTHGGFGGHYQAQAVREEAVGMET